ncbi:MAG: DUF928 domain-containing protein [Cyanobacteria bacterium P01_D01_bin.36]
MKYNRFASTLGAFALLLGTAWTQGGVAHAVGFTPPADNSAPRDGTGGASRGSFFTPPADSSAPRETTGGSTRGGFFTPPADSGAPVETTGGSTRGDFFTPPADSSAPRETTGGSTRGDFFAPPADSSTPQGSTGGASRSLLNMDSEAVIDSSAAHGTARSNAYGTTASLNSLSVGSMMAVVPDSFYGTTIEARPTILVYVPASNATEAVFSLKNEAKDMVYQTVIAVPESGGVVAVALPEDAPELAVGENYQWYLAMLLDNELSPASPFVDGWVKRISPDSELANSLSQSEGIADVAALGANGIWYDTVAQLARLNETQTNEEMTGHWYELLESVGLEEIATAPLVL